MMQSPSIRLFRHLFTQALELLGRGKLTPRPAFGDDANRRAT
jgi:hypothetical protein